MDHLFIVEPAVEGENWAAGGNLGIQRKWMKDLLRSFLKSRAGENEGIKFSDYELLQDFMRWLKKQPDPNAGISYDVPKIPPTKLA